LSGNLNRATRQALKALGDDDGWGSVINDLNVGI
jgi:hypothetical protein